MNSIQRTLSQYRPCRSSSDPLLHKLEDAIHHIIVRRSAPDWLNRLVEKLANPLTEEESMSTTTVRGWPSSEYFIQGLLFLISGKKKFRLSCRENGNRFSFNFC
ncbi:hypothetical protein UlMin_045717 [Ulmus minor]